VEGSDVRTGILLLACPALLFGQLDSDTITISVNQIVPASPDQAIFNVIVGTPASAAIDDVLAALAPAGVTLSDLSTASTFTPALLPQPISFWYFTPVIALAKLNDELGALARIQQNLSKANSAWTLSYSVIGTQTSAAAKPSCAYTTLVSYAQKQAQQTAAAAGVKVGPVIGLSDSPAGIVGVPVLASRSGDFVAGIPPGFLGVLSAVPPTVNTCSMAVQFRLQR
jgi:hypothetical protein